MQRAKFFKVWSVLMLVVFMMGCAGGSSALVKEKDTELEQLRAELGQLEKRLENEKKSVQGPKCQAG